MAALNIRGGLLVALASLIENTALRHVGFSSCAPPGSRAQAQQLWWWALLLCGSSRTRDEALCPALAGEFLTAGPLGKSSSYCRWVDWQPFSLYAVNIWLLPPNLRPRLSAAPRSPPPWGFCGEASELWGSGALCACPLPEGPHTVPRAAQRWGAPPHIVSLVLSLSVVGN